MIISTTSHSITHKFKSKISEEFTITYHMKDGSKLNGVVSQTQANDYTVYVKEKEVIIHCTVDEDGFLNCKLNSKKNPQWVDGITRELAKKLRNSD